MKAVLLTGFGGVDVLEPADVPTPSPGPGQLLVRVRAAAVNPVDYQTRRGDYRDAMTLPAVIGPDVWGVGGEIGPGVRDFRPGDEVYAMTRLFEGAGGYAQYVAIDEAGRRRQPGNPAPQGGAGPPRRAG